MDQRRNVVVRIPAGGSLAQFLFEIAVAHRVFIAAARRVLYQIVRFAFGGGDLTVRGPRGAEYESP